MNENTYTSTPPDRTGWYWLKWHGDESVNQVDDHGGELCVHVGREWRCVAEMYDAKWSGPLQPPKS